MQYSKAIQLLNLTPSRMLAQHQATATGIQAAHGRKTPLRFKVACSVILSATTK